MPFKLKFKTFIILYFFSIFQIINAQIPSNFDNLFAETSILVDKDDYIKAHDQALDLEIMGSENNDALQIAKANYLIAKIFKKQENYLQTIKYSSTSIEFAEKAKNIEFQIKSKELLAWSYVYIGFYDEADEIIKEIDGLLINYNGYDKHFLTYKKLYRQASLLRKKEEKPKQILQIYFQALKEINQFNFKNNYQKNENLLSLYKNIGKTYKDINIDSSYVYFQKAYKYRDLNDSRGIADLETNIASYYVAKNENKKAIEILNQSIPTLIKSEHKFLTAESFKILAEAYKNKGNSIKNSEYNTLYLTYKDSLNTKKNQSVNEAIEYVKKINKKNEENTQNKNIYLYSGLAILFIIIVFFVFRRMNKKTL